MTENNRNTIDQDSKKTCCSLPHLMVRGLRFISDRCFPVCDLRKLIFIESIAAIPGMVSSALLHFRSLRTLQDNPHIRTLFEEAENERMHLMTFLGMVSLRKTREKILMGVTQVFFILFYAIIHTISEKTAHVFVALMEDEAIKSYDAYLEILKKSTFHQVAIPEHARALWNLAPDANLVDLVQAIRDDEVRHRDSREKIHKTK